ncbi:MAG TPA: LysM peptidoglycan-binding domain-containing protein [Kofleriaceae bacterium]|nr:LysM peptidoglycan-binding domain-containing protein [Kofleriaceae bacterium]
MRWLLILALVAGDARAQGSDDTITYKVKAGDTLELLAAEYYGDRNDALFIMVANKMTHPRPLKKGEKLRVPVSREVTTSIGDTFDTLAQAYLGDTRRGPFLAEFNGVAPDDSLAAGTVINVPFTITYTADADIGLDRIAQAYFGDAERANVLRAYNFLDKDTLAKGETVEVPIFHVRVRESMLPPVDPDAKARSEKRRLMQDQALTALPGSRAAWRAGDFSAVKRDLIKIDTDFLDVKLAVEIGVLLGGAYVATGDTDSALATFKRVLERRPKQALDAYRFSPKIRDVWKRAGGTIE